MPKDSTSGRADLGAANLNPTGGLAVAGGQTVTMNITFETGRSPNLTGLHDALITLYGAGKVTYDTDSVARNLFRVRVAA
jgi:hypothetical protein